MVFCRRGFKLLIYLIIYHHIVDSNFKLNAANILFKILKK